MKVIDTKQPITAPLNWSSPTETRARESIIYGAIVTPWGLVCVYAQGGEGAHTRLDFAHEGTLHSRFIDGKRYSSRGLVAQAMAFAEHVVTP